MHDAVDRMVTREGRRLTELVRWISCHGLPGFWKRQTDHLRS